MNRNVKVVVMFVAACFVAGLLAPAAAEAHDQRGRPSIEVTTGEFVTLPGGASLGHNVRGNAVLIRLAHLTVVAVRVRGLDANTTYPTHVHNAPCSATPAGGSHYQHEVGTGPEFVNNVNEIWPVVQTSRRGHGYGLAIHPNRARDDAMSIVIHYPADTSIRLACVDLT